MKQLYLEHDVICDFVNGTPRSKNMIEGLQIINSGMIVECGATHKAVDRFDLYSSIFQTSDLTHDPHIVTGMLTIKLLNNNNEEDIYNIEIITINCSCIAGKSCSCKHIPRQDKISQQCRKPGTTFRMLQPHSCSITVATLQCDVAAIMLRYFTLSG
ncbi:hypothetical protein PV327_011441, partial [Microctonus hyperodae]